MAYRKKRTDYPREDQKSQKPEEDLHTEDPKEGNMTQDYKEDLTNENSEEDPITIECKNDPIVNDLLELQEHYHCKNTGIFEIAHDRVGNADKFSYENYGLGIPRFRSTAT